MTKAPPPDAAAPRPIWGPKRFSGSVSDNELSVQCDFTAEIARNGSLMIKLDEVLIDQSSRFLFDAMKIGTRFPEFRLAGASEDGEKLQSDRVFFTSPGHRSDETGGYFVAAGSCIVAKLTLNKKPDDTRTQVKHHLIGFQSFSIIEVPTPYGPLRMGGAKDAPHTEIGGVLFLGASQEAMTDEAMSKEIEEFLEHIIWIMSFAGGTMIRNPIREFVFADRIELQLRNFSAGTPPLLPTFHYLNLAPILSCAVSSFSSRHQEAKELRPVIEFHLMHATYTETRIVNLCAAFEHLASRYLEPDKQKRMDDDRFKNICDTLAGILETSSLCGKDRRFVQDTIERSNWLQLEQKIKRFLRAWDVPMQDIPTTAISDMVMARNVIAHGNLMREDDRTKDKDAWDVVLHARELLVRVILLRIGFTGAYQSYPGGQHSRLFPSCKRQ